MKLSLLSFGLALSTLVGCASSAPPPAQTTPPPMPTSVSMPPSDEVSLVHRDSTRPTPADSKTPTTDITPQNSALGKKLRLR